ncbi:hypothetical protein PPACK8108_LOCUS5453 [Phakopsora pachyrhizi]|uniref:Uncharacterized protein n=1 Tax=Phakopsora pachyrhizi TaxID=170000 RepID=A0AAV0ARP7_PHAPC|nr:hypothetical protein PPACK8108_LOCUS5453 [Phakopsora pachyrhizi]
MNYIAKNSLFYLSLSIAHVQVTRLSLDLFPNFPSLAQPDRVVASDLEAINPAKRVPEKDWLSLRPSSCDERQNKKRLKIGEEKCSAVHEHVASSGVGGINDHRKPDFQKQQSEKISEIKLGNLKYHISSTDSYGTSQNTLLRSPDNYNSHNDSNKKIFSLQSFQWVISVFPPKPGNNNKDQAFFDDWGLNYNKNIENFNQHVPYITASNNAGREKDLSYQMFNNNSNKNQNQPWNIGQPMVNMGLQTRNPPNVIEALATHQKFINDQNMAFRLELKKLGLDFNSDFSDKSIKPITIPGDNRLVANDSENQNWRDGKGKQLLDGSSKDNQSLTTLRTNNERDRINLPEVGVKTYGNEEQSTVSFDPEKKFERYLMQLIDPNEQYIRLDLIHAYMSKAKELERSSISVSMLKILDYISSYTQTELKRQRLIIIDSEISCFLKQPKVESISRYEFYSIFEQIDLDQNSNTYLNLKSITSIMIKLGDLYHTANNMVAKVWLMIDLWVKHCKPDFAKELGDEIRKKHNFKPFLNSFLHILLELSACRTDQNENSDRKIEILNSISLRA